MEKAVIQGSGALEFGNYVQTYQGIVNCDKFKERGRETYDYRICISKKIALTTGGSSSLTKEILINSPSQETRPRNMAVRYLVRALP